MIPPVILADRLIPTREAAARFGYSVDGLLAAAKAGRFPAPIRLANNRCVWAESVLTAHMNALKASAAGGHTDAA